MKTYFLFVYMIDLGYFIGMEKKNTEEQPKDLRPLVTLVVIMSVLLVVGLGLVIYGIVTQFNELTSK